MSKHPPVGILLAIALLAGCGTVKEKTAPCKRPTELTSYVQAPLQSCGPMRGLNDPHVAFVEIGLE